MTDTRTYWEKTTDAVVTKIIAADLPSCYWWEADGSCWMAAKDGTAPKGWRWQPMNAKALAKEEPETQMTDHYPVSSPATSCKNVDDVDGSSENNLM